MISKKIATIIFFLYIAFILNFIVFKFFGDFSDIINTIMINQNRFTSDQAMLINLVPFQTIKHDVIYAPYNLLANIILFIPMGVLIPIIFPSFKSLFKTLSLCSAIIFLIEIIQRVTFLGSFDVDDIFLNLLGSLIGYILLKLLVSRVGDTEVDKS